jgi:hypothetical protein
VSGSLVFDPTTVATKSFHLPKRVLYDEIQQVLLVEIGSGRGAGGATARPVMLSRDCLALVAAEQLVGFLIRSV